MNRTEARNNIRKIVRYIPRGGDVVDCFLTSLSGTGFYWHLTEGARTQNETITGGYLLFYSLVGLGAIRNYLERRK